MQRQSPVFPFVEQLTGKLEKTYLGQKLRCGKVCPHKGTSLVGATTDARGNLLCPTHGLAFHPKTEKCVKRFSSPAAEIKYMNEKLLSDGK